MKHLVNALKVIVPLAIIAWLITAIDAEKRAALITQPKDWGTLAAAFLVLFAAVCLSFTRWFLLVRALEIPFRIQDAFRLGSISYLLNFVSFGNVGGDLFKAVLVAREHPGRRTEAIATIVVDRICGLAGLLITTSIAITIIDLEDPPAVVTAICRSTYAATAVAAFGALIVLTPSFATGPIARWLTGLRGVGETARRVITSLQMYRTKWRTMILVLFTASGVHALLALGTCLIAMGLFKSTPTVGEHFLIVPLSNVAASLPFTPSGLGSYEFAMSKLYEVVPNQGPGDVIGVLVALGYRCLTLGVAAVGMIYYWTCRREVKEALQEAADEPERTTTQPA